MSCSHPSVDLEIEPQRAGIADRPDARVSHFTLRMIPRDSCGTIPSDRFCMFHRHFICRFDCPRPDQPAAVSIPTPRSGSAAPRRLVYPGITSFQYVVYAL